MNKLTLSAIVGLMLCGCTASNEPQIVENNMADQGNEASLKSLAAQVNLSVGTAFETRHLQDPLFRQKVIEEFSQLTPENEMKFSYVQPQRGQFDFSKADQLVEFALENNMTVKGHALVWHIQNPSWLEDGQWSKEELAEILETHIKTVVSHYKGQVKYWDVVNEAFNDNGGFRETLWYNALGEEYIEMAFRFAHEADPDAILFYNDYSTEGMNAKANGVYRHVKKLLEKGVPIHGVGTQLHLTSDGPISDVSIARNIERLSELGLKTHFTEIDVRLRDGDGESALFDQAKRYEMLMKLAVFYPQVDLYTTWGLTDKYSWVPNWFKGYGRPLLFDENYQPKAAYNAVHQVLEDASAGTFSYQPATDLTLVQRYVQAFDAKALPSGAFDANAVVYYPFAYNQLGVRNQTVPKAENISGKWAVGYHDNQLIGQVLRHDDFTVTNNKQAHENDNVELFIRLGDKFWQFRSIVGQDFAAANFPGEIQGEWSNDGQQFDFVIEFDDYEDLVGETIGFNIALSDNDNTAEDSVRHAQLYPLSGSNIGWQGEEFGELFMNGQNAVVAAVPVALPPTFVAKSLTQKPVDAESSVWQESYHYSLAFNQLDKKDMTVSQDSIAATWSVGHHDNWLYGMVQRQDDITVTSMEESYLNDNVELFFQRGEELMQFRSTVGKDFEKIRYPHQYRAQWSDDGQTLYFAIELDKPIASGEAIGWNIAMSDNDDGKARRYQLYPVPGSNISYLGEELTKLTFE
ncbi:endo-1,4-beta-xylanase [Vibrio sp. SM6]|uniref:Beta-xylanase n=1 Tax=Vibrio agarilyticus TaxID=2726741 RepID=A0A7X8YGA0_9VIBR|nr:endo-1,4-beta-xylanase [Vibrio agarilyticus]NLS12191.1 endo-1,4-beta-xylanase [Vibrio agarilyticus]